MLEDNCSFDDNIDAELDCLLSGYDEEVVDQLLASCKFDLFAGTSSNNVKDTPSIYIGEMPVSNEMVTLLGK